MSNPLEMTNRSRGKFSLYYLSLLLPTSRRLCVRNVVFCVQLHTPGNTLVTLVMKEINELRDPSILWTSGFVATLDPNVGPCVKARACDGEEGERTRRTKPRKATHGATKRAAVNAETTMRFKMEGVGAPMGGRAGRRFVGVGCRCGDVEIGGIEGRVRTSRGRGREQMAGLPSVRGMEIGEPCSARKEKRRALRRLLFGLVRART